MIKNGYKRRYFWGKKSFWRRDWLGFCAPLVVNCILNLCWTAGESYGLSRALQLKSSSCFVLFSPLFCAFFFCLSFAFSPGLVYGWLLNDLRVYVSRYQTAVDAAGSQSSLQSSLLFLGSQDCNDGLVEHRLQALLGQSWTFHIATCTNLTRIKERTISRRITVQYDGQLAVIIFKVRL